MLHVQSYKRICFWYITTFKYKTVGILILLKLLELQPAHHSSRLWVPAYVHDVEENVSFSILLACGFQFPAGTGDVEENVSFSILLACGFQHT